MGKNYSVEEKNNVLTSAFVWLFVGLLICFGTSYFCSNYAANIYSKSNIIIFIVLELGIALAFGFLIKKMPPIVAKILYILYTAVTGLSLTGIFLVYTSESIAYVFLATSIIFAAFAILGKTTKIDLTKWGIYLLVALIAIIIISVINIFIGSSTLYMIISIATILVFSAYVAYDVNMALNKTFLMDTENKGIYCAFQLFLDFINLFIELLRLFGKSKD